jgi:heterodisulfide reductase subunit A
MRIIDKLGEDYDRDVRKKGIIFIKYLENSKPKIIDNKIVVQDVFSGENFEICPDLIVLTVPLEGNIDAPTLSKLLKVPITTGNFFNEAHVKLRPLDFATDGIYLCGCAHSPQGISSTITQAIGAASRCAQILSKNKLESEGTISVVDPNLCIKCELCKDLCPYNAVEIVDNKASIIPAACKGCGICSAACPEHAISLQSFTDKQIIEQISVAYGGS